MGCCESTELDSDEEQFLPNQGESQRTPAPRQQNVISTTKPKFEPPHIWEIHELLAETEKIDGIIARNIVQLFENQNTIPFICRYRRDLISNRITPDKLRDIKNAYVGIIGLRKRAETIINQLEQVIDVNDEIRAQLLAAKTFKELEFLHKAYTPVNSEVRVLEYQVHAYRLLTGDTPIIHLECIVDRRDPRLDTFEKVRIVLSHLGAELFSKHTGIRQELMRLQKVVKIVLKCSKIEQQIPVANDTASNAAAFTSSHGSRQDQSKYEKYFNFEKEVRYIRPHQILAINRGARFKYLKVDVIVPNDVKNYLKSYVHTIFMCTGVQYCLRDEIFEMAFDDFYIKNSLPFINQHVRADLTEMGKKAALAGFAMNLKQLLLMPPLKGERILGMDPGFANGCKLALISETADVLEVGVIYPLNEQNDTEKYAAKLAEMLSKHKCRKIALGNGAGCRETEAWLTKLYDNGILERNLVRYHIVSEKGASVYSCSDVAKQEFPDLDLKYISAISIARRLNDPLSEYVKIEPRHLGIGMYQHDLNQRLLTKSVNEVVSECVSFVGVDVNTASLCLLKHVAGLDEKRAQNIIHYRRQNGPFRTRKQLLKVKTIGGKVFTQCAGFIRIEPKSFGGMLDNMLDCTWVHPESYPVANKIITKCNLEVEDIGKPGFIGKIQDFVKSSTIEDLATSFGIPSARLQVILEALQRQLSLDYRFDKLEVKPLFMQHITRIEDLFIGEIVTGEVRNIVDFGVFVDIGIEADGLIHNRKMNGKKLNIGDRVSATVLDIDIPKRHVELRLDEII